MIDHYEDYGLLYRLLQALTEQVAWQAKPKLTPEAAEALSYLDPAEIDLTLTVIRHLADSDVSADSLSTLVHLISEAQQTDAVIQWDGEASPPAESPDASSTHVPPTIEADKPEGPPLTDVGLDTRLVEAVTDALAKQVEGTEGQSLAPGATAALRNLNRVETRSFFGFTGIRVHYDMSTADRKLIDLVSDIHRAAASTAAATRPGDQVALVPDPWFEDMDVTYTVRYVGDDGTVDIQPELWMDYTVETVPMTALAPAPAPDPTSP
jgi:hypothetical protein